MASWPVSSCRTVQVRVGDAHRGRPRRSRRRRTPSRHGLHPTARPVLGLQHHHVETLPGQAVGGAQPGQGRRPRTSTLGRADPARITGRPRRRRAARRPGRADRREAPYPAHATCWSARDEQQRPRIQLRAAPSVQFEHAQRHATPCRAAATRVCTADRRVPVQQRVNPGPARRRASAPPPSHRCGTRQPGTVGRGEVVHCRSRGRPRRRRR